MPTNKLLSMLGMARRAGRLSMGHDAAKKSVKTKKARLLLFCSDVSPGLVREFKSIAEGSNLPIPVINLNFTMDEVYFSTGGRAGVITVDDENFSRKIISLSGQEEHVNGN